MKNLQVRLPDGVHGRLKSLAEQEGVSLNQMLVVAASNEVVRQETRDFFKQAAQRFDAQKWEDTLARIAAKPSPPPLPGDELPALNNRADLADFDAILAAVPSAPPVSGDELPHSPKPR